MNKWIAVLSWLMLAAAAGAAERPNFIVILTDDMGYADVGFNGCKDIPTPNIDSIASGGIRFTNGYVSHPFCSPSRAGLMTGRYQQRFGHENNPVYNTQDTRSGLPLSETMLPAVLRPVGYVTGIVGKWHLGAAEQFHPLNRGFDEFFGFLGGGHQYLPDRWGKQAEYTTDLMRNREYVTETEYLTDALSREAVSFVERHRGQPFFLYLAYNAPHTPLQATGKYLDRFKGIADEKRRTYAAMVSAADDGIGRLLGKVKELGLEEKTLVFFMSDNGGPVGINGSDNRPLRAGKGTVFEGGIRVPMAAKWKGVLAAGKTYEQPVISLDVFPTVAALAGAKLPEKKLDGVDLMPYLRDGKGGPPHEVLFWRTGGGVAYGVRAGDYKLDEPARGEKMLFNVTQDIGEGSDVASAEPERVGRIEKLREQWDGELVKPVFPGPAGNGKGKKKGKGSPD